MSTEKSELFAALAKAQGEFTNPARNKTVKVQTKTGGAYTFDYATLDAIMDVVRKPLSSNGLSLTCALKKVDGVNWLYTILFHGSGESIESGMPIAVDGQGNQAIGSAMTYARRYTLCNLLGIAADEDDDGNAGDGHSANGHQKQKPPANSDKAIAELTAALAADPTLDEFNDIAMKAATLKGDVRAQAMAAVKEHARMAKLAWDDKLAKFVRKETSAV